MHSTQPPAWKIGVCLALSALLTAACGPSGAATPAPGGEAATPEVAPTDSPTEPAGATGACDHPYLPVGPGVSRTYSGTGGPFGGVTFTDSVSDLRPDGFTLVADFGDLTRVQEWSCTDAGLVALTVPAGPEASVSTGGSTLELEVLEVSGVTLPADLAPGRTWSQTYQLTGTQTLADGQTANVTGSAEYTAQAVGFEEVSLAAGSFSALRVEQTFTLNLTIALSGLSVPVVYESVETAHLVEGVGMVKTAGVGTMFGESYEEVIELQSYSIP